MSNAEQEWRVGPLARLTGVTVRTLHHYDRIGLLRPSSRTAGGHRCYTAADVRRLHAIVAMRGFGLRLSEILRALDGGEHNPRAVIETQLAVIEERIDRAVAVRFRLFGMLAALDGAKPPSGSDFITLIEEMNAVEAPMTPAMLAELNRRRRAAMAALDEGQRAEMARRRQEVRAALTPEQLAGMQRERARWMPATG